MSKLTFVMCVCDLMLTKVILEKVLMRNRRAKLF